AVSLLSGPLADVGPDVIALVVIFGAVALLTWHGWWMGWHARELRGALQRRVDAAHASHQLWMVGLIAFTGVFREGAETVLFLWGLMTQIEDLTGWAALAGAAGGLLGYRARPSVLEVVAYVVYLAGAGMLFFPNVFRSGARRNGDVTEPAQTSRV